MPLCKICQSATIEVGAKDGRACKECFILYRCPNCHYAFVGNPLRDHAKIYTEEYYRGRGYDPLAYFMFDLENPENTIHYYEWAGIQAVIESLFPKVLDSSVRWLDFGAGAGGLVRFIRSTCGCDIIGYDKGWIVDKANEHGIAITRDQGLIKSGEKFDIITAIEVLEHLEDPISVLNEIRSLLKPGGLFFYTTGNSYIHRKSLLNWSYFIPEIHISLYEPLTMKIALEKTGFHPQFYRGVPAGWYNIIRYKILKNFHVSRRNTIEKLLPWGVICRLANIVYQVSAHPVGWAVGRKDDV